MMWGGGECHEPINWLGVGQWHSTSHGNPTGAGQQTLIKFHTYLSSEFAYFIQKLKALDLFDSTVTLWGTQNGNSTETGFSKENHDRRNALFVAKAWVDPGPVIKRFQPKDRGKAYPINKRTSHLVVTIDEREE